MYGCVAGAGLSDRARVLDELARVQPRGARIATSRRRMRERLPMLDLFTSSPGNESPETSLEGVREPSGESSSHHAVAPPPSDSGEGSPVLPVLLGRHTFKIGSPARAGFKSPARASPPASAEGSGAPGDARQAKTRGSRWRTCIRPRPQSRLPQSPLPFRTKPRGFSRSRFMTSSEAVLCRWPSSASA